MSDTKFIKTNDAIVLIANSKAFQITKSDIRFNEAVRIADAGFSAFDFEDFSIAEIFASHGLVIAGTKVLTFDGSAYDLPFLNEYMLKNLIRECTYDDFKFLLKVGNLDLMKAWLNSALATPIESDELHGTIKAWQMKYNKDNFFLYNITDDKNYTRHDVMAADLRQVDDFSEVFTLVHD